MIIKSLLAGSVNDIFFKTGDRVEVGDTIMQIDLMKMLFPVDAEVAGIVTLRVVAGQSIQEGDVLAEIE